MLIEDTCSEGLDLLCLIVGETVGGDECVGEQRGRARNKSVLACLKPPSSSRQAGLRRTDCPLRTKSMDFQRSGVMCMPMSLQYTFLAFSARYSFIQQRISCHMHLSFVNLKQRDQKKRTEPPCEPDLFLWLF